ncbi:serine protease [Rhodoblastus acidophilus]|uniref:Serine protease n=1 Tax=Candidatus Rhodoblastus alkanivorans TaxID=2954117 RepID=A0ABS9Z5L7_9HYPH|nr:serine protease [Candidatus Rhodoblastus alkanivorans]MCI4678411.1 serine protease [Candidatus Rhodoblastus alkanivorans]MCI4682916.1 serine protease [Candidatus Rhodoblastus alkanivorans]MDI4640226.1 serine protease [Rhodoblastus acidophilus]
MDKWSVEPLLLTSTRFSTFRQGQILTGASGFFFLRDDRLFVVTSRHVLVDKASGHFPDSIEIELHIDGDDLAKATGFSVPLYDDGKPAWRQGADKSGDIDVAAIEIEREALPDSTIYRAFTPDHLPGPSETIETGAFILVVGFPLGFHDTLHHLPVVRQGVIASSFGLRFQGQGFFLTDARTHRGASGSPVVTRAVSREGAALDPPWLLLGVHSTRFDVARDLDRDEALGLNCAWYADILMTLTE